MQSGYKELQHGNAEIQQIQIFSQFKQKNTEQNQKQQKTQKNSKNPKFFINQTFHHNQVTQSKTHSQIELIKSQLSQQINPINNNNNNINNINTPFNNNQTQLLQLQLQSKQQQIFSNNNINDNQSKNQSNINTTQNLMILKKISSINLQVQKGSAQKLQQGMQVEESDSYSSTNKLGDPINHLEFHHSDVLLHANSITQTSNYSNYNQHCGAKNNEKDDCGENQIQNQTSLDQQNQQQYQLQQNQNQHNSNSNSNSQKRWKKRTSQSLVKNANKFYFQKIMIFMKDQFVVDDNENSLSSQKRPYSYDKMKIIVHNILEQSKQQTINLKFFRLCCMKLIDSNLEQIKRQKEDEKLHSLVFQDLWKNQDISEINELKQDLTIQIQEYLIKFDFDREIKDHNICKQPETVQRYREWREQIKINLNKLQNGQFVTRF